MAGQLTRAMDLLWASFRRGWGNKIPTTKTYKGRVTRAIKGIPYQDHYFTKRTIVGLD